MARVFMLLMMFLVSTSFIHPSDDSAASSPSPEGDTRMGADAASSGTDITDKELQAQEEKGIIRPEENGPKKEDPSEEDHTDIDVK